MVSCSCGKPLEKVPSWLQGTSVNFVCNNCPNRTVKAITQVNLEIVKEPEARVTGAIEMEHVEGESED